MPRNTYTYISPEVMAKYAKPIAKAVQQLLTNETYSADLDQKSYRLWTVRLNRKVRLFLTEYAPVAGEQADLFLLHVMDNHRYERVLPAVEKLKMLVRNGDLGGFREYTIDETTKNVIPTIITAEVGDEAEPEPLPLLVEPARLFRKTFLQLTSTQETVVHARGSFIAYGVPGAGKSSSAVFLLEQLIDSPTLQEAAKPIVVLAETQGVVNQLEADYQSLRVQQQTTEIVEFRTIENFVKNVLLSSAEKMTLVNYKVFSAYYNEQKENFFSTPKRPKTQKKGATMAIISELKQACKFPENIAENDQEEFLCHALYQELCLLAPWGAYETEGRIRVNQTISYFKIVDFSAVKN